MGDKTAKKTVKKLEELEVIFVSGVAKPATGERFLLIKDMQGVAFREWVTGLRSSKPDLARQMDECLERGNYDRLRALVKTEGGDEILTQLNHRLALLEKEVSPLEEWEEIELSESDIRELAEKSEISAVDVIDLLAYKREWTSEMRRKHKEEGGYFAGPGTSYPLKTCADVRAAIMAAGRAKRGGGDPAAIRRKVIKFAKDHNMTHCLPAATQEEIGKKSNSVVDSLVSALAGAAGYDLVPRGTAAALSAIRDATDAILKSIAAGYGDDDAPVSSAITLLNNVIHETGKAPATPAPPRTRGVKQQNPDLRYGTVFAGSANEAAITEGTPFPGSAEMDVVVHGVPATKAAVDALLKAAAALSGKRKKKPADEDEEVAEFEGDDEEDIVEPDEEDTELDTDVDDSGRKKKKRR